MIGYENKIAINKILKISFVFFIFLLFGFLIFSNLACDKTESENITGPGGDGENDQGGEIFNLTLNASPQSILANGISHSNITAYLTNKNDQVIPDALIRFTANGGTLVGAIEGVVSNYTDDNGHCKVSLVSNTTPGYYTIYANYQIATRANVQIHFLEIPPDDDQGSGIPKTVELTANPERLPVGGSTTVWATLLDETDTLVQQSYLVHFDSDLGQISEENVWSSSGIAQTKLTSLICGEIQVWASLDNGVVSDPLPITFLSVNPNHLSLSADDVCLKIGEETSIYAEVRENTCIVANVPVYFTTTLGQINPSVAYSDDSGLATATLTNINDSSGTAVIEGTCLGAKDTLQIQMGVCP